MRLFFEPESVVLIGVSRKSGPGAYNNLEVMLKYGFAGRIYVVHPKVPEILGHPTYSTVSDLPETPDLAVISVGRDRVLQILSDCIAKGIKRVIVISQGFADADERGKELQKELSLLARGSGTRIVGPNTMGVLNAFNGFSTAFVDIVRDPAPPGIAIVVQSGVFQVGFESFTGQLGKAIDVGNACDLDFVDALAYLENDPQTRLIVLHMEGMMRGRQFLSTCSRIVRKKPIVILKTGRSDAGAKAALSHTGSLVGEDAVFDTAFARAGLLRVRNMIEMHAVAKALIHFRPLSGPRLAVVTATGACGIMTADACEDYGLRLAACPERIPRELENEHIAWHKLHNPIDIWPLGMVGGSFIEVFKSAVRILFQDDNVDAILGIAPALASPMHRDVDVPAAMAELKSANIGHKPVALWLYGGDQHRQGRLIDEIPDTACFTTIDEAIMGMAACHRYYHARQQTREVPLLPDGGPGGPVPRVSLPKQGVLVGEEAFNVLRQYNIPVVPGRVAASLDEARTIAQDVDYPVALKIISSQWLHKSDMGGIKLNIASDGDLQQAQAELVQAFQEKTPTGSLDGILVQKQIKGTEILLGLKRDPQFGPILVVGMGGIYTEVLKDVARGIVPVDLDEARRMIESLRLYPILAGARGQQAVKIEVIQQTMVALSQLAMDHPPIAELDLNPVLANADGCWCVDCRIVLA